VTTAVAAAPRRARLLGLGTRFASYSGFVPAIILLGLFFLVPLGIIVCYSFWETIDYSVVHHWTLDNYHYFFSVSAYVTTMWATLWVAALATAIAIGLAFPFAYWLSRYVPPRIRTPLLVLVIVPFWTSYLLRVYAWQAILGETGALNQFLMQLGIIDKPSTLFVYNDLGVFVVLLYVYFPFAALALYAALEKFDFTQLNAAQDLGARPDQAFRHILIPQIRTGIITACIFVFIPILGEFLTPTLVGGAQGTLIANLIVNFTRQAQIPEGSALAILIAAFVTVLLIVFRKSLRVEDVVTRG
jgi:spermidine/putrescine transport system permease protein